MAFIECPWCEVEYDLTVETEPVHLAECKVFQSLPVAEFKDGKTYVALPGRPDILCERLRVN